MSIKKTITAHMPHNTLSAKMWSGDKMLPEFRSALLKIANEFIDYLGIQIDVIDVTMTGSYANYNYTVFSDIDLHVIIDMESVNKDADLVEEFFNAKRSFWNDRHDIELKGVEVELYPQDANESHASSGVYSIYDDLWVVKPKKFKTKFDIANVEKASKRIIDEINIAIKKAEKKSTTDPLKSMIKKLKKMRSAGLEKSGELSNENITYKIIRSEGYLQKLFDTRYRIEDLKLSEV